MDPELQREAALKEADQRVRRLSDGLERRAR